jgi:hypothetical protein
MNIIDKIALLIDHLIDMIPVHQCAKCEGWFGRKGVSFQRTTIGVNAPVCHECWREMNTFGGRP